MHLIAFGILELLRPQAGPNPDVEGNCPCCASLVHVPYVLLQL